MYLYLFGCSLRYLNPTLWIETPATPLLSKHSNTTANMEKAKQERSRAKGQFTRSKKSLSDAVNHPDPSVATIERRFDDLKKRWDHVQETHDEYAEHASDMQPEEADKLDEWIDAIAKEFEDLEMVSDKKADSIKLKSSQSAPTFNKGNPTSNATSNVGAVKVERMKFAQFDGDIRR